MGENQSIAVRQTYDAQGRPLAASEPYFANGPSSTTPGTASLGQMVRWTTTTYDALGRVKAITRPNGAQVVTAYDGWTTTVTQPANDSQQTETGLPRKLRH